MKGVVNCVAYANGSKLADVEVDSIHKVLKTHPECFIWVGLHEPDAVLLQKIQQAFGLHDLAIEDAHRAHQRPKLEQYGDSLFVVLRTAQKEAIGTSTTFGETHIFLGQRYLVSVRHGASMSYAELRSRCQTTPELLNKGPGFVLYALMDFIVDKYFPIVDELEAELESLEEAIFNEQFNRNTTTRIYDLKRELVTIKRGVSPIVDICNRLMRNDFAVIPEDTRPYFRDVYDHVIRINEMVDTLRELLGAALEANLSLISVAQSEATKKLASWAAIIAVPTMVAGIYGMNFQFMPELHWRYGYPLILGVTVLLCGVLYRRFKRAGWL